MFLAFAKTFAVATKQTHHISNMILDDCMIERTESSNDDRLRT